MRIHIIGTRVTIKKINLEQKVPSNQAHAISEYKFNVSNK